MKYRLGIDLGTSYFKFGLFDGSMTMKGLGRVEVKKDAPAGGMCEVPVRRFHDLIRHGIAGACEDAGGADPASIGAVGFSSQANSFLLMDGRDRPLTPLVLWSDRRAATVFPEVKRLWEQPDFLKATGMGMGPSPHLCVNKLLWFRTNRPEIWRDVGSVLTISDYLVYMFTGEKKGDMGTASLLGLFDARRACWWEKAFGIVDIDKDFFAEKFRSGAELGRTTGAFSRGTGLKEGVPVFTGSLDHHMAALGAGAEGDGGVSESTGTVLAAVNFTGEYRPQPGVCVSPWDKPGSYCRLVFDGNGAVSLEWYQKNYAPDHSLSELVAMAERERSSGGLSARPEVYRCERIEEAFTGLTGRQSHGHFVYALLMSTAGTLSELLQRLCPGNPPQRVISTGGGARSPFWLELKSEVTGIPFVASGCRESACRGAAMVDRASDT